MTHAYGWVPDLPDIRDYLYSPKVVLTLPASEDLSSNCPPVVDQGQLGSCTANAGGNAHLFVQMNQNDDNPFLPSRLKLYYDERTHKKEDTGATIRGLFKTMAKYGVCPEEMWPYDISKFAKRPPKKCYTVSQEHQALQYLRVSQTENDIKSCIASGYPVVIGFSVYESFESDEVARTGIAYLPVTGESFLGGHAVMVVGYNDVSQRWKLMNSWGMDWGDNGYFTLPYPYLTDRGLSSDFWTLRRVEN